jgi:hypothetical protein
MDSLDITLTVIDQWKQVYGPHTSVLYVRASCLKSSVSSIVHHFIDAESTSYKLQPGGPGYELVYGSTGILDYLLSLTPHNDLKKTFEAIATHEQTLVSALLSYLTDPDQRARGVRVVGNEKGGLSRVPTISFVVVGQRALKSKDIVGAFDEKGGVSGGCSVHYYLTKVDDCWIRLGSVMGISTLSL